MSLTEYESSRTADWSVGVRDITVTLTRACNLSCEYCYQGSSQRTRLDWPRLKELLRPLIVAPTVMRVTFTGGEPLLEFGLIQEMVAAARREEFGVVAFRWILNTNGMLLDHDRLQWLRDRRFRIHLSLEVDPGQPRAVEKSLAALRTIREGGGFQPHDDVVIVVVPGSATNLARAAREAVEAGARKVTLSPDLRPHRPAVEAEDEWFGLLEDLEIELRSNGNPHPIANFRGVGSSVEAGQGSICAAFDGSKVTIDADGVAWTCPVVTSTSDLSNGSRTALAEETRLGSTLDPAFPERLASTPERVRRQTEFHLTAPDPNQSQECERCSARDSCRICPATRLLMRNRELATPGEFYCGFFRAMDRVRRTADRDCLDTGT